MAKNQANAKHHPEAELLRFENSHILLPRYYPKKLGHILKNKENNKFVCIHRIIRLIIRRMKMKLKNRSHRYDINRPRSRHGRRYSKYITCITMMMLIFIKQQLRNKLNS